MSTAVWLKQNSDRKTSKLSHKFSVCIRRRRQSARSAAAAAAAQSKIDTVIQPRRKEKRTGSEFKQRTEIQLCDIPVSLSPRSYGRVLRRSARLELTASQLLKHRGAYPKQQQQTSRPTWLLRHVGHKATQTSASNTAWGTCCWPWRRDQSQRADLFTVNKPIIMA